MIFIFIYLFTRNYFNKSILNPEMVGSFKTLRRNVVTKVDQSAIFASFGGEGVGKSKKLRWVGSIESQQKFDFFCSDIMP